MRKYIFFIFIINIIQPTTLMPCPCEFSTDDERPFFEQYETENKSADAQEKDKKS